VIDREHLERGHIDALARLARAGKDGLQLGDGFCLSSALLWGAHGCLTITNRTQTPQFAVITAKGRAQAQRSAA